MSNQSFEVFPHFWSPMLPKILPIFRISILNSSACCFNSRAFFGDCWYNEYSLSKNDLKWFTCDGKSLFITSSTDNSSLLLAQCQTKTCGKCCFINVTTPFFLPIITAASSVATEIRFSFRNSLENPMDSKQFSNVLQIQGAAEQLAYLNLAPWSDGCSEQGGGYHIREGKV